MYVLIKVDVDHENENEVSFITSSDSLDAIKNRMVFEWQKEMVSPTPKWVRAWDGEYSYYEGNRATCQIEALDWAIHWQIFDTAYDDRDVYQGFTFI